MQDVTEERMTEITEADREKARWALLEHSALAPTDDEVEWLARFRAEARAEEYERLYQLIVNRISADIAGNFELALDQLEYNHDAAGFRRGVMMAAKLAGGWFIAGHSVAGPERATQLVRDILALLPQAEPGEGE